MRARQIKVSLGRKLRTPGSAARFAEMKSRQPALAGFAGPADIPSEPAADVTRALVREYQAGHSVLACDVLTLGWIDRLSSWSGILRGVPAPDALMSTVKRFLETLKELPEGEPEPAGWISGRLRKTLRKDSRRRQAALRNEVPCRPDGEEEKVPDPSPDPEERLELEEGGPDPEETAMDLWTAVWEQLPAAQRAFLEEMHGFRNALPRALGNFFPEMDRKELLRLSDTLRHRRNRLVRALRERLGRLMDEVSGQG